MSPQKSPFLSLRSVLCIGFVLLAFCGTLFYGYPYIRDYLQSQKKYHTVKEPEATAAPLGMGIDFDALKAINPDTIGYIRIQGTAIDYPVVQSDNNETYLHTAFDGEETSRGTVFLDSAYNFNRVPKAQNSVLYGHSHQIQTTSLFGDLHNYLNEDFYQAHRQIAFDRLIGPGTWTVFAVLKVSETYDYRRPDFADATDFSTYYDRIQADSLYPSDLTLSPNDEILTLSTCVFDIEDGRLAVIAVKEKS